MANFAFYKAKASELRQRVLWIKDSLDRVERIHDEIKPWIQERCDYFEEQIEKMERLISSGNPAYLPRLRIKHVPLEEQLLFVSNFIGVMLREGSFEEKFSKVVKRICHECGFSVRDFLIDFTTGLNGPAVRAGQGRNPIFYVRDETLASAFSWIPLFHEIGHIVVAQNRGPIIQSLVQIVREHYRREREAIGPVDENTRRRQEVALNIAERYWTEGVNDIRLEELFCDCFAIYSSGVAYLFFWLDFGIGFEKYPKFVNECDTHPPFKARFEACWRLLPESIKTSGFGATINTLWEDYVAASFSNTNPHLEYGTVCHQQLIENLAEKSINLIQQFWPSLGQWNESPPSKPENVGMEKPIAEILNGLVALLFSDRDSYREMDRRVLQSLLEE